MKIDAELLELGLQSLAPRSRFVLEERSDGRTLESIGGDLDVTRERVRQIFQKAQRDIQVYFTRSERKS